MSAAGPQDSENASLIPIRPQGRAQVPRNRMSKRGRQLIPTKRVLGLHLGKLKTRNSGETKKTECLRLSSGLPKLLPRPDGT